MAPALVIFGGEMLAQELDLNSLELASEGDTRKLLEVLVELVEQILQRSTRFPNRALQTARDINLLNCRPVLAESHGEQIAHGRVEHAASKRVVGSLAAENEHRCVTVPSCSLPHPPLSLACQGFEVDSGASPATPQVSRVAATLRLVHLHLVTQPTQKSTPPHRVQKSPIVHPCRPEPRTRGCRPQPSPELPAAKRRWLAALQHTDHPGTLQLCNDLARLFFANEGTLAAEAVIVAAGGIAARYTTHALDLPQFGQKIQAIEFVDSEDLFRIGRSRDGVCGVQGDQACDDAQSNDMSVRLHRVLLLLVPDCRK